MNILFCTSGLHPSDSIFELFELWICDDPQPPVWGVDILHSCLMWPSCELWQWAPCHHSQESWCCFWTKTQSVRTQNWVMMAPHQGRLYWKGSSDQRNFVISDLSWYICAVFPHIGVFSPVSFPIILADVSRCKINIIMRTWIHDNIIFT